MRASSGPPAGRFEVVATLLLALAAVATAWSGDQASRWHGEQAVAFSRANASRLEPTRASNLANPQTEIDVATFGQGVDAYAGHQTRLAEFSRRRFGSELQPAVAAQAAAAQAGRDLQHANDDVLAVVLFSAALCFGASSTRLQRPHPKALVLGVGGVVLVGTLAWVATGPLGCSI